MRETALLASGISSWTKGEMGNPNKNPGNPIINPVKPNNK
jgi:hypothetical protein